MSSTFTLINGVELQELVMNLLGWSPEIKIRVMEVGPAESEYAPVVKYDEGCDVLWLNMPYGSVSLALANNEVWTLVVNDDDGSKLEAWEVCPFVARTKKEAYELLFRWMKEDVRVCLEAEGWNTDNPEEEDSDPHISLLLERQSKLDGLDANLHDLSLDSDFDLFKDELTQLAQDWISFSIDKTFMGSIERVPND